MRGVSWTLGAVALAAAVGGGTYYERDPHVLGLVLPVGALVLGAASLVAASRPKPLPH